MQVRKWLNWGSNSSGSGDYPDPDVDSANPEALFRNPEAPESATAFLAGLDRDQIKSWAKQLYMKAKSETIEEVVSDRLLLALDAFAELQGKVSELDDRLASQRHTASGAIREAEGRASRAEGYAATWKKAAKSLRLLKNTLQVVADRTLKERNEYRLALIQISTGICTRSKMFTGACSASFPGNPTSWCGSCLAREVVSQFDG